MSGEQVASVGERIQEIYAVSPDNNYFIQSDNREEFMVMYLGTGEGKMVARFQPEKEFSTVAFSTDNQRLVFKNDNQRVVAMYKLTGELEWQRPESDADFRKQMYFSISPDGKSILKSLGSCEFDATCVNETSILQRVANTVFPPFMQGENFQRGFQAIFQKNPQSKIACIVSKGISHPVFYGDLVYKLRRVKRSNNFIASGTKIVKRLRRRHYDPGFIEKTIGLVLGPSTAMYRLFLKHCTPTNKAVGTI